MRARALALVTLAAAVMRLAGRLIVAVSQEIDAACADYKVEIPDYVPDAWQVQS